MIFFVAGKPVPQGSMSYFKGRMVHQNDKELQAWRDIVGWCARRYFPEQLKGAVTLTVEFILPKPKSVTRDEPFVKPDLDKLVRAIGDALTGIAFADDSQVTALVATKRYAVNELVGVRISVQTTDAD